MNRRAILAGVAASVAVVLLWFLVLWQPRASDLDEARERRETAEDEAEQLALRLARLEDLQANAPRIQARLGELRAAVPDQPDLAQFILEANDAANQAGIEFLAITPSPPSEGEPGGPTGIRLSLTVTGGYFQVVDFVNRLTGLTRVVVIDTLNLSASSASGVLDINTAITGRMFTTAPPAGTEEEVESGTPPTTTATTSTTEVAG